ncbi:guanylate kinase [Spirillospora sp. CA-294931]|uniref:guanylate kinase n=1 Tax=Spirillospora sp. CA-294931 TaxID=3240042 RepID=UPI003D8B462F
MTRQGVILYGPPASGKDTVTAALSGQDDRFALLPKLKAGTGRSTGYRHVTPEELDALHHAGRLIVETQRYGNRYAVDRQDVEHMTRAGRIPIIHMGNLADVAALRSAVPLEWTAVLLWIPRAVSAERSKHRGDVDTPKRIQAWEDTDAEIRATGEKPPFDLAIHTDQTEPTDAARRIIRAVELRQSPKASPDS